MGGEAVASPWLEWELHPSVILGLACLGGLYVLLGGASAPRRRLVAFGGSLFLLLITLNGPLDELSDQYLFSVHMVQHLLLTLVFPPLFLYGLPAAVVRRVARPGWVLRGGRFLVRPLVAALLFTAVIVFWHLPRFYDAALRDEAVHIVEHLMFLVVSVIMWWPVLSPVPELPRTSYPGQMLYLFLLGIPMSIVGALITLAAQPLYTFYVGVPRLFGLSPLADQEIGGLIMWVPGGLIFWLAMTVVWFRWSAREDRGDVEREVPLEAYGLPAD
jgi:putative membrane protein